MNTKMKTAEGREGDSKQSTVGKYRRSEGRGWT